MADPIPSRVSYAITTSYGVVLTVPAGKFAQIVSCTVNNVDGVNAADVTIEFRNTGAPIVAQSFVAAQAVTVNPKDPLSPLAGVKLMRAADDMRALASASGDLVINVDYFLLDQPA